MDTPDSVALYVKESPLPEQAARIAARWQLSVTEVPPPGLALIIEEGQLQLKDFAEPKQQGVVVDFRSGESQYRQQHGGGRKEAVARALGVKDPGSWHIVDATPGLGRDAFVLASLGCKVTMIERSVVVAALLADGLERLYQVQPQFSQRLTLKFGNSINIMQSWSDEPVDAIYLDPMFPHRKKSALVKKEMRVFQQLLGADADADALLAPALKLAQSRVAVKRPNYAEPLALETPSMAVESKKHRFDIYLCHKQGNSDD